MTSIQLRRQHKNNNVTSATDKSCLTNVSIRFLANLSVTGAGVWRNITVLMCSHLYRARFEQQLFQKTSHHFVQKENFWCRLLFDFPSPTSTKKKTHANGKCITQDTNSATNPEKILCFSPYTYRVLRCPWGWVWGPCLSSCQSTRTEGFSAANCDSHPSHLDRTARSERQHCKTTQSFTQSR